MVLKPTGRSFADTVRGLKDKVDPEQEGIAVQKISITRDGEVRLLVKETRRGARQAFSETLQKRAADLDAEVRDATPAVPVAVRDLDATVGVEELREALAKAGVELASTVPISLGEPRQGRFGGRTAIVRLTREAAVRLLGRRSIVVGWAKRRCRITEWEQPQCCFKCQRFGHNARDCGGETQLARKCYRCGEEGHIAKTCQAAPSCYACGVKGHRADSLGCPKRREAPVARTRGARGGGCLAVGARAPTGAPLATAAATGAAKRLTKRQKRRAQEVKEFDYDQTCKTMGFFTREGRWEITQLLLVSNA